jgi:hypothetical protein
VGRIEASHFDAGTAYVAFDGHRDDNFTPWIFRTTDYGATWENITANIPVGHVVHLVREDLRNPDLLFAGTEFALYASLDRGRSWHRLNNNLPNVNIQDLVIHPREMDLVAGTHGRGIWILDDISPLQQLTRAVRGKAGHLFEQKVATLWENRSRGGQRGHFWFGGENPRTFQSAGSLPRVRHRNVAIVTYWLGNAQGATLEIADLEGSRRRAVTLPAEAGIGRYEWDLRFDGDSTARAPRAGPGTYRLTLTAGGERSTTTLVVRADPLQLTTP